MEKSTVTITKGRDFTAISFEKPIANLVIYAYNGIYFTNEVDVTETMTFWDKGQTIEIYDGRQWVYSCTKTSLRIDGKWEYIIIDAWSKNGKVFDYHDRYKKLLESL